MPSTKDDLAREMCRALSEIWMFGFKAHAFHWNVTGKLFPQLHEFFGEIYKDSDDAVDDLAERIRTLGYQAPSSPQQIMRPAAITFNLKAPTDAQEMVKQLAADNRKVEAALYAALDCAEDLDEGGIANFLQDRCDKNSKWGWMLKASAGGKMGDIIKRGDISEKAAQRRGL